MTNHGFGRVEEQNQELKPATDYLGSAEHNGLDYLTSDEIKAYRRVPRWVKVIVTFFLCLGVGFGFLEYSKIQTTADHVVVKPVTKTKISPKVKQGKPITVLAMGTDTGALHRGNGIGNTDSMELFTINPKTKRITMTSIPRDTLIHVYNGKTDQFCKLNAADQLGGPRESCRQVSRLLDVPVDYYAIINMGVLKKVVNSVNGVDVNNQLDFTYEGHHFPKGPQHLNGNLALKYSRMRYDDPNNDYGRQKRQQQILSDVIVKFKQKGSITAANEILDAISDGVQTDAPVNKISTMYSKYHAALKTTKTYHFQGQNATIDGVSYQIASPNEINRVSKIIRTELGMKPKHIDNAQCRWYQKQNGFNGTTNQNFELPKDN